MAECVRLQAEEALEQERDEIEQGGPARLEDARTGTPCWDCPPCSDEWHAALTGLLGDDEGD